jgi:hypothetical protein
MADTHASPRERPSRRRGPRGCRGDGPPAVHRIEQLAEHRAPTGECQAVVLRRDLRTRPGPALAGDARARSARPAELRPRRERPRRDRRAGGRSPGTDRSRRLRRSPHPSHGQAPGRVWRMSFNVSSACSDSMAVSSPRRRSVATRTTTPAHCRRASPHAPRVTGSAAARTRGRSARARASGSPTSSRTTTDVSRPSMLGPTFGDAAADVAPLMRLPLGVAAGCAQPRPVRPARPEYPDGLTSNHTALGYEVVFRANA